MVGSEGVEGFGGEEALPFEGGLRPGFGILVPGPSGKPRAGGGLVLDFVVEVGGDESGVDEIGERGVRGWCEGEGFGAVGGPLLWVAGEDCGDGAAEFGEDEDVAGRGEFLCEAEVGEEGVEFEGVGEVD